MSDLLSIGASGVRAFNTALGTVSENIANAGTEGYVRRTTSLAEITTTGGGLTTGAIRQGNGVTVAGIGRSGDALKEMAVRLASTDLAKTESGSVWLGRIESALTGNALGDRITSFFNAASTLASDPTSLTSRASLLESASAVASGFAASGKAFDQSFADLDATADQATAQLDQLAAGLAKANDGLGRVMPGSSAAAQLQDQRDQLLERMSAITDLNVSTDSFGRATVKIGSGSGATMVEGTESGTLTYVRNASGAVSFALHRAGGVSAVTPGGGALAGVVEGAGRLHDAADSLDKLATNFTTAVNQVQTQGVDLSGTAGKALFAVGSSPTDVTLAMSDPAGVAAASAGGGTRDASNLSQLQAVRRSGGYEATLTGLVSGNAASIQSRRTIAEAQGAIRDGAVTARDAVSGVDMDKEAVDLLRFQQAYQASSRVIQVARETFQSILAIN